MMKRTGLMCVIAVAVLAACSKAPQQAAAPAADAATTPPAATTEPAPPPALDRAKKAEGLLTLIDTAPQCQTFRTQIEEAAKAPADSVTPVDMNQIVADAHAAGCGKKP